MNWISNKVAKQRQNHTHDYSMRGWKKNGKQNLIQQCCCFSWIASTPSGLDRGAFSTALLASCFAATWKPPALRSLGNPDAGNDDEETSPPAVQSHRSQRAIEYWRIRKIRHSVPLYWKNEHGGNVSCRVKIVVQKNKGGCLCEVNSVRPCGNAGGGDPLKKNTCEKAFFDE